MSFQQFKQFYINENGKAHKAFFKTVIDDFFIYDNKLRNLVCLVAILIEEKNNKNIEKFIAEATKEHNPTKFGDSVSYCADVVDFKKRVLNELASIVVSDVEEENVSTWCNIDNRHKTEKRWDTFASICYNQLEKYVTEFSTKGYLERNVYSLIHELMYVAKSFPSFTYLYNDHLFNQYMCKIAQGAVVVALDKETESWVKENRFRDVYSSVKIADIDGSFRSAIITVVMLSPGADKISSLEEINKYHRAAKERIAALNWL